MTMSETTVAIIKPDAVRHALVGTILEMAYNRRQLVPIALTMNEFPVSFWEKFYAEHAERPFFEELVTFMSTGRSVVAALHGADAIAGWRSLMGATDPKKAEPGTIRALYGSSGPANAVHGSASFEAAQREMQLVGEFLGAPSSLFLYE